ncbi:HAD family hydrolase [Mesomycoplasma neurolyticum]|uniref:COF family HAD hydrolase protein n=1 Tax=Mesomycoplasma neurolyticum TaxID=2120 RepID=A0A449A4N9_9BACT|nr:HAD family hydrolase [Mesomycoplasma neurolyticum]VEU59221.1 COF family HAD hydrolase protein [Mesomycoplasma neurolyticum]
MKNMIAFSDVDGTIYGKDYKYSKELQQSILDFQKKGGYFVIATGNPPFSRIQKLATELNVRYLITSNGATIFDNIEKKYIYKNLIDKSTQQKVFEIAKKHKTQLNCWNEENFYTYNRWKEHSKSYNYSLLDVSVIKEYNENVNNLVKMELFGDKESILNSYNELKKMNVTIAFMRDEHLEITMPNTSKGIALKWFVENHFNDSIENVMSIGDSPNDWSMLEITGFSYAVENASEKTKEKAKFYTSRYDQNGVSMALLDYMDRFNSKKLS